MSFSSPASPWSRRTRRRSRELFVDALGLPLEADAGGDYFHSEHVDGTRHFGVWPLAQAAQACFGADEWPADVTVPQASIEFEVESPGAVADAAAELEERGFQLLHPVREEPWGQTVAPPALGRGPDRRHLVRPVVPRERVSRLATIG